MMAETVLYKRPKEPIVARLSLISLMDIFTILVFFLMLNSGETQQIDVDRFVDLPESISGNSLRDELTIILDKDYIIVDETVVTEVASVLQDTSKPIEPLLQLLNSNTEKLGELANQQKKVGYAVTIMADKTVNYELLKTVMETCREKNYLNISLAVNQIEGDVAASSVTDLIGSGG